jgi:hypothetical protein
VTLPYRRARAAATDFKPPKPNRVFIGLMRLFNLVYGIPRAKLVCDARDLEKLKRLPLA